MAFDSIRGGNVFGSLEGDMHKADDVDVTQVAIFVISKFVDEERDLGSKHEEYEKEIEDSLLHPDSEDSTELGEIPHEPRKGGVGKWPGAVAAYSLHGMYR